MLHIRELGSDLVTNLKQVTFRPLEEHQFLGTETRHLTRQF